MRNLLLVIIISLFFLGCSDPVDEGDFAPAVPADTITDKSTNEDPGDSNNNNNSDTTSSSFYFPALTGNDWLTIFPDSLSWDSTKLAEMLTFVESKNTYGFIILHKGKIVIEKYWNGWNPGDTISNCICGKKYCSIVSRHCSGRRSPFDQRKNIALPGN